MKRRAITLLLVLALVLSLGTVALAAGSLSNFQKVNTFQDGQFWDVSSGHWAYSNVRSAYEYGLMKGESDTAFAPDSSLTVAATITMAARLHSIYNTGSENFVQGNPWYQCYVDYALQNGLITGEYANYDAAIQRWEFAQILGRALPDTALQAINTVEDGAIPDVAMSASFAPDVYRLYRAGILAGSGTDGSFTPYTGILRSEAAAIVSRMVEPELRKRFTLSAEAELRPVSVSSLPGGLSAFLNQFYGCYGSADDREYHSVAAAGSDILASLVSNPVCVDTRLYPGEQPQMHWMDGTTDPRGWCEATLSYGQFDQDQVDWIAQNIFHVSGEDLIALRAEGESSGRFYLQDGYYYTPIGGVGSSFYEARPTNAVTDGVRYYLAYDVYFTFDGDEYWDTCYAVLGRETIGRVQYWTLYDHTHTPLPELSAGD